MENLARTPAPTPLADPVFDDGGYLLDATCWTPGLSETIARDQGLGPLTEEHWRVIHCLRDRYLRWGGAPAIRSICRRTHLSRREIHTLFGSCSAVWRIAGLPDPGEEAKAYLM